MTTNRPDSDQIENRRVEKVLELALSLKQTQKVDEIITEITDKVLHFFKAKAIRLFIYNPEKNELYTRIRFEDVYEELTIPISNNSVVGYTANNKNIVELHDVHDPNELKKYPGLNYDDQWEKMTGIGVRAVLSAPLLIENDLFLGVIQIINGIDHGRYSSGDITFLRLLGSLIVSEVFQIQNHRHPVSKYDLLIENNLVTEDEIREAIDLSNDSEKDPVSIIMEKYQIPDSMMGASLARFFLTDFFSFQPSFEVDQTLLTHTSKKYLQTNCILPIAYENGKLSLVMTNPSDQAVVKEIKRLFGANQCKLYVGLKKDILRHINKIDTPLSTGDSISSLLASLPENRAIESDFIQEDISGEEDSVVTDAVNRIILEAKEQDISDIHIEPGRADSKTQVRFRQDGICFDFMSFPDPVGKLIINRIKVMAGLKLEEKRIPQSGKIRLHHSGNKIELRVESTPTVGQKEDLVMRILASARNYNMDELNLSNTNVSNLKKLIMKPYGLLLTVGPTGSGKTTTLHSVLGRLNTPDKKIWTAEDPVEITQDGLRQVQVNYNIKPQPYDFPRAMRSFLRADPDIIMIGEMRDLETARIAVEASLTGHLVLSTLHTNSAPETLTRLVEMGINQTNLSDALLGVLAQRLVNTLCIDCREPYHPTDDEYRILINEYGPDHTSDLPLSADKKLTLYRPKGCVRCNETGYKGRSGIHELLTCTPKIKSMIRNGSYVDDIRKAALKEGMRTLKMDGIQNVIAGKTDLKQVLRVCID